jgi:hypothetical protein
MNCAICGKGFDNGIAKIVGEEVVHEECYNKRLEEEAKMKETIVDAEAVEVTDADEKQAAAQPKCEVIVGMETNGNLYFLARGEDPSLLNIEGLIKFAQLKIDQVWAERMAPKQPTDSAETPEQ